MVETTESLTVLIRKGSSHASLLVLTLEGAIPSGHVHRHALFTSLRYILHVQTLVNIHIRWRQVQSSGCDLPCLILQHPSDFTEVFICKNTNRSTSVME